MMQTERSRYETAVVVMSRDTLVGRDTEGTNTQRHATTKSRTAFQTTNFHARHRCVCAALFSFVPC